MTRKKVQSAPSPLDLSPPAGAKKAPPKASSKKAKPKRAPKRVAERAKKVPNPAPSSVIESPIGTSLDDLRQALPTDMQPEPAPEGWQVVPLPDRRNAKAPDPLAEVLRVRCPDCACPDCPVNEGASRALKGNRVRHSHACRNCGREFTHIHRIPEASAAQETADDDHAD